MARSPYTCTTLPALLDLLLPRRWRAAGQVTEAAGRVGATPTHLANLRQGRRRVARCYLVPLQHALGMDRALAVLSELLWEQQWARTPAAAQAAAAAVASFLAAPPTWREDPDRPLNRSSAALGADERALPDLLSALRRMVDAHPEPPPLADFCWAAAAASRWPTEVGREPLPPMSRVVLDRTEVADRPALRQTLAVARFAQWVRSPHERLIHFLQATLPWAAAATLCALGRDTLDRMQALLEPEPPVGVPCQLVSLGAQILVLGQAAPPLQPVLERPSPVAPRPRNAMPFKLPGLLQGQDYRLVLLQWHERRQSRHPGFTQAALAQTLGLSASHIYNVFHLRRHLGPEHIERLAPRLGLQPLERELLDLRVAHGQCEDPVQRSRLEERLAGVLAACAAEGTAPLYQRGVRSPLHAAVYVLAGHPAFSADPRWIVDSLGVSAAEAQGALTDLMAAGLLVHDDQGCPRPVQPALYTGQDYTAHSPTLVSDQMLHVAQVALPSDRAAPLHRAALGWVRLDRLSALRAEAVGLQREVTALALRHEADPDADTLYAVLSQVIPLSQPWPAPAAGGSVAPDAATR